MKSQTKIENIVRAARSDNKTAEDEFFSKLNVRFLSESTCKLQKYPILTNRINFEDMSQEICNDAIKEVKRLSKISTKKYTI